MGRPCLKGAVDLRFAILLTHGDPRLAYLFSRHLVIYGPNDCWLWRGGKDRGGYGIFSYWVPETKTFRSVRAHRFSYRCVHGAVPPLLDHKECDTPACVNPSHVVGATPRENTLRSNLAPAAINARKTECINGHPFSGDNLRHRRSGGGRDCVACMRAKYLRLKAKLCTAGVQV